MNLTVTTSPHIRGGFETRHIMRDVALALLPSLAVGAVVLGVRALTVTAVSVLCALAAQWLYDRLTGGGSTLPDGSALVTGLLFAMTLPVSAPYPVVVFGSVFAVGVKCFGDGLGQNVFNPALMGRAAALLLFPAGLTVYAADGVSGATPLHQMAMGALPENGLKALFLGTVPGSIGELSVLTLLLGGGYQLARRVISPRIPLSFLGTVAMLTLVFSKTDSPVLWMLCNLCSGGVVLGAVFMATDYATSPVTPAGQWIFGAGCGLLTVVFRYFGLFPEGVTYAILLMNALVWSIDRLTAPRRFGEKRRARV